MACDMCGKPEDIYKAIIEDAELYVCEGCAKFGKVIGKKAGQIEKTKPKSAKLEREKIELIADNFAELIKRKREELGLTQKEFAKRINEKESVVHKIETGNVPSIHLARKLEKLLKIKLIEEYEGGNEKLEKRKDAGFTLGDFMKVKE